MKLSLYRHPALLRRWAARVLFLWLFGVVASVANACLVPALPAPGEHTVPHDHRPGSEPHASVDPEGAAAAAVHHAAPGDDSPGTANCLDFCDKARISIPPLKSALDDGQAQALAPPALPAVLPVPAFMPVRQQVPRRADVAAEPILMAFLRLAL